MTPDHYTFRTVAELLREVRDHHRLSQRGLADRSGVTQAQLARYEKGTAEPTLAVLRRILVGVGWAPMLSVEPTSAAVDQQLDLADELGAPVLDTDVHLLLRVCASAGDAGARLVVGGEVAAALQGVPTRSTDLRVVVTAEDLRTLLDEAHRQHRAVERPDPCDDHSDHNGDPEWLLWAGPVPARVHVLDVLPAARAAELHGMRLHVVDLDVLRHTGALAPATAALAARRAQRAGAAG